MSFQAPSRMVVYAIEETREPIFFDASGKGDFCISCKFTIAGTKCCRLIDLTDRPSLML